jgi:nitroreductase
METAMSDFAQSNGAWPIDPIAFPGNGSPRDKLAFLIRYAVLAPSGHNTQPWRFVLGNSHVDVVADMSRALKTVDPQDRELTMSCGAAAETLLSAIQAYGFRGTLTPLPQIEAPTVIARVELGDGARSTAIDRDMLNAIARRRTVRRPYATRPIPAPCRP